MGYRAFKNRLNNYFAGYVGGDNRPSFFDIKQTFPSLNTLTENYSAIKNEFNVAYQANPDMPLYHEIDPGEKEISNTTANRWKVFMLYLLGHKPQENRKFCPQTCQLLDGIPNMIQAFFSVLEPGKSIPPHKGPYLGYLRYHLGIQVPKVNPPSIIVNNQEYTWQEGEAVLFDDSWTHAVVNNSPEMRVVLIVDVLRPLPTVPHLINKTMTGLLARYTYGRNVMKRMRGHKVADAPIIN